MATSSARVFDEPRARGWIRSAPFDLVFVFGVLAVALAMGGLASASPALFVPILLVDLWLFAYPHVASTLTRVVLDRASRREHWALIFIAPPAILLATGALGFWGGAMALNTLYFVWQSYHYTRQSYGIARAYRRASGEPAEGRDLATDLVVFAFPVWGLLHRAHEAPASFYRMPLYSPPVPALVVTFAGAVALTSLGVWVALRLRAAARGDTAALPGALFVASHVFITWLSYFALRDVTEGWLFLNVWHNLQYLLFVWAVNAKQHGARPDPERPVLAWLSQPRHALWFALGCFGTSAMFYGALGTLSLPSLDRVLPVVLVTHLAVNFHHYVVDSVIWRRKRA